MNLDKYEFEVHIDRIDLLKALLPQKQKSNNPILIVWRAFYYSINHWWENNGYF